MPQPRTDCHHCGREVAITNAGNLYPHREDPTSSDEQCPGSNTNAWSTLQGEGLSYTHVPGHPEMTEPEPPPEPPLSGADELAAWWRMTAQAEIDMVVGKAVEYGATDLRDLGHQILEMAGRGRTVRMTDDAEATEIGIAFYAAGKLARIMAAVKEGRRPSLDTWLDLGVYARMAQRVHHHGGWPAIQSPLQVRRHRVVRPITEQELAEQRRQDEAMQPVLRRVLEGLKEI